jgi:hypothetical protein
MLFKVLAKIKVNHTTIYVYSYTHYVSYNFLTCLICLTKTAAIVDETYIEDKHV